jgi:hypothetical protein
MTKICSIYQHINGEHGHNVYEVNKCAECGWHIEPRTVTLGMFTTTYPDKCLKTSLMKGGSRTIKNINILPSWCPLKDKPE